MIKKNILIIAHQEKTRIFLENILRIEFNTLTAEHGILGIDYARNKNIDLIILDMILPILGGNDTFSLLKKDKKTKNIPIIFLSSDLNKKNIIKKLNNQLDYVICFPLDYKNIIQMIQKNIKKSLENNQPIIKLGKLQIHQIKREIFFSGIQQILTFTEFDILKHLVLKAGKIVSREELIENININSTINHRTIDFHIRAIRKKIPPITQHLLSIYGAGYKYEV